MNRKKKIAIIGAGNAACITAMHYYFFGKNYLDKIKIYYDPESPIERVGQGSTLAIPKLIHDVFNINWYNQSDLLKATRKDGILYENWGKRKDKITHYFPLNSTSFHYVPQLLSKLVLNSGLFDVVEAKIDDPEKEIDSDYIFDCRGRHNRDENLYEKLTNPLNSVILAKTYELDSSLTYTRCVATPDGWTFAIPNHDGVSYGYLFNKEITDKETAEKNMKELFNVEPDGHLVFENYIAKKCFQGERTFLSGNKLAFLEPLEATSTTFHLEVAKYTWDHIMNGVDKELCNKNIKDEMKRIETFVLWHYQKGSKYNTPFWEYAKSLPFYVDKEFVDMVNFSNYNDLMHLNINPKFYSQWSSLSFKNWIDGTY
jgi:hypothetical protein